MKKVLRLCLIASLCMALAGCGPAHSGGSNPASPGKISDVIAYLDDGAELAYRMDTVDGLVCEIAYSKEQAEEMAELLNQIDLSALEKTEESMPDGDEAYVDLVVNKENETGWRILICGTEEGKCSLNLLNDQDGLACSYIGDAVPLHLDELSEIESEVRQYSQSEDDFMELTAEDGQVSALKKDLSLWLKTVMDYVTAGSTEEAETADFDVSMKMGGRTYYLSTKQPMAGVDEDGRIRCAELGEEHYRAIRQKLNSYIGRQEQLAMEMKACRDADNLETELGRTAPYTRMYRTFQRYRSLWYDEDSALRYAKNTWTVEAEILWYMEKEGITVDENAVEQSMETAVSAYTAMELYTEASEEAGMTLEEWIEADRQSYVLSASLNAIYETCAGGNLETLNDLMKQIGKDYLESEEYKAAEPKLERCLELLAEGGLRSAEELAGEDIFLE